MTATHVSVCSRLVIDSEPIAPQQIEVLGELAYRLPEQAIGPAFLDNKEGGHIAGVVYRTDFDASQEYGLRDLRTAFCGAANFAYQMRKPAIGNVAVFSDVNGFALSSRSFGVPAPEVTWGTSELGYALSDEYVSFFDRHLEYTQGTPDRWTRHESMADLRAAATSLGIKPLPRSHDGLLAAIQAHPDRRAASQYPNFWPASFRGGETLVLRADTGVTADILVGLRDAVVSGNLAFGNASGPFSTGTFLFDGRDETETMVRERREYQEWYDVQMAALEPVAAALRADGYSWHFLGNPSKLARKGESEKQVCYWLNGTTVREINKQPYGWYTLEELAAHKFIADATRQ